MLARLRRLWCALRWRHKPLTEWGPPLRFPGGRMVRFFCQRCGVMFDEVRNDTDIQFL